MSRLDEIRGKSFYNYCPPPNGHPQTITPQDVKWLISRIRKLEEALKFYAEKGNYDNDGILYYRCTPFQQIPDNGEIARKALADD